LQSAKPVVQLAMPQVVPTQLGNPFATLQVLPHAPQLFTSS
jgi:hypothetical protein